MITCGLTHISPIKVSETFIYIFIYLKLSQIHFWLLSGGNFQSIFFPFRETDVLEITAASIQHSVFSSDSCGDAQSSLDKHVLQWKRREKLESFIFQILKISRLAHCGITGVYLRPPESKARAHPDRRLYHIFTTHKDVSLISRWKAFELYLSELVVLWEQPSSDW